MDKYEKKKRLNRIYELTVWSILVIGFFFYTNYVKKYDNLYVDFSIIFIRFVVSIIPLIFLIIFRLVFEEYPFESLRCAISSRKYRNISKPIEEVISGHETSQIRSGEGEIDNIT